MTKELLKYFKGNELAANVWLSKYALEGENTPDDMHKRMTKEFTRIEDKYIKDEIALINMSDIVNNNMSDYYNSRFKNGWHLTEDRIHKLFENFKYIIPQGSIMATLGTNQIASLSNCWVIESPVDSYGGIHKADGDLIYYYKRRGGVGMDISKLRPEGTNTNNSAKSTTGAVSFMERFSNTTREVAMNGRRGALMISMDVNHPDILEFAKIKTDKTKVTGANISIKINNEFMKAVENDEDYFLRFPCDLDVSGFISSDFAEYNKSYSIGGGISGFIKKIKAKEYWDEFIKQAKDNAEPGLMYWDNVINYDPASVYEQYKPITTNPCGEQALQPNDSCRLMVHNLFSYVVNPFTKDAYFDYTLFYNHCYEGLRLGDDLVDLEAEYIQRIIDKIKSDPESDIIKLQELMLWEKSLKICLEGRRVGMGITALGDTLAALGFKYDSNEALVEIEKIMKTKMEAELDCTIDLSILRGSFKNANSQLEIKHILQVDTKTNKHTDKIEFGNKWYEFIHKTFPEQSKRMHKFQRRSINFSTIAPTGSVSLLADNCTSGCEPLFSPYYFRKKKINPGQENTRVDFVDQNGDSWQEFPVLHPKFKDWIDSTRMKGTTDYSKEDLEVLFKESPWYGSTANDIDWLKRVEIQAILQKYTTNAISSTINLPSTVTYEEVSNIYMEGWKKGLKGQTVKYMQHIIVI